MSPAGLRNGNRHIRAHVAAHRGLDDGVFNLQEIEQPSVWPSPCTLLRTSFVCSEHAVSGTDCKRGAAGTCNLHKVAPIDAVHNSAPRLSRRFRDGVFPGITT